MTRSPKSPPRHDPQSRDSPTGALIPSGYPTCSRSASRPAAELTVPVTGHGVDERRRFTLLTDAALPSGRIRGLSGDTVRQHFAFAAKNNVLATPTRFQSEMRQKNIPLARVWPTEAPRDGEGACNKQTRQLRALDPSIALAMSHTKKWPICSAICASCCATWCVIRRGGMRLPPPAGPSPWTLVARGCPQRSASTCCRECRRRSLPITGRLSGSIRLSPHLPQ